MLKKLFTLLLSVFLAGNVLLGQNVPVQANLVLVPPYTLSLADYTSPGENRLSLNILLKDLLTTSYQVKLRVTIEANGFSIVTRQNYMPSPITLQGGVPEILSGNDLADYFSPENLDFRGLNKTEYLRTNKLPEGYYKFTVEVLDYNRSNLVSNRAVANAYITLNDPPIINRPSNNTKINITDPTNIVFNWTPRHMGSPNSAFSTEYHFKMVEIWPQGRNPYEAMRTSPVLYEATVTTTSLVYDMMCPQLIPGKEYAFTITAADVNGRDLFKNGGESETYRFIYGDECKPPTAITARAVTGNGIEVSWTPGLSSTGFNINYRAKGTDRWYDQNTLQANTRVYELPPSTEIEYKVNAECGSTESSFSTIQTIKTKDAGEAKAFVCGNPNTKNDISNRNDVTSLMPGAVIDAGGFEARITSVTRNDNGSFTGECIVTMPYFNYAKVPHTFSKIRVNVLNQMYEGRLLSKKNPDSPFVKTIKKQNAEDEKLANAIQTSAGEITADKTVKIDATIISITVDPATGDYIVKKEDGSTEVVKAEESKKTLITDKNGDQYLAGGGTVNKVSGAGIENNTAQASTVDDIAGAVDKLSALEFSASSNATAGFDKFKNDALKDAYNEETILGNSYSIPWKAVEAGGVDYVEVALPEKSNNFNPASVSFTKESGATVVSTQSASGKKQLLITGGTADETEGLEAKYLLKDKEGKEQSELIGKINIASYNKKLVNLRIVPVNGDKTSTVDIQNKLNKIYGQAVTSINVQTLGGITVSDLENAESFEDAGTGLLSHYTGDMKKVIKAFKNSGGTVDDEAYYLFLIPTKPTGSRTGFMPLKSQFGFIFTGNGIPDLAQSMAHELGHGAFRLYHTFSSNNKYTLSASTTDNLMDYRNGTELDKYQWDYVQNPQGGLYLFQKEEEGASEAPYFTIKLKNIYDLPDNLKNSDVSYITPAGTIITLPSSFKPSFTGKTGDDNLNKSIPLGCLLGYSDGTNNYVSKFYTTNNIWHFSGYYKAQTDNNCGKTGLSKSGLVLIGKETSYCNIALLTGNYSGETYKDNDPRPILTTDIVLTGQINELAQINQTNCDLLPEAIAKLDPVSYKDLFAANVWAKYNNYGDGGLLEKFSLDDKIVYLYTNEDSRGNVYTYRYYESEGWKIFQIPMPEDNFEVISAATQTKFLLRIAKESGHTTLDILGTVPGLGEGFDALNGFWYLIEGEKGQAALCLASTVPFVGWISTGSKWAYKGAKKIGRAVKGAKGTLEFEKLSDEAIEIITKKISDIKFPSGLIEDLAVDLKNSPELLKKFADNPELVEAWEMAAKHADLRTNTTALSKLNDIASRGRGIDKTKLKAALDGDLGDVLNKATGDNLTNILNRLDAEHVTGSHLDEITSRLSKYSEVKTELLNNPSQFEFFDEVLQNPENYRELAQTGEITTSSKLYQWALGKFRKQILDNAEKLETTVSSNIRNYVEVPDGYKTATQIHLGDGTKRTVPDDFIYSAVRETDPVTGDYYRAIIHDSKLHADVPWTDNQYNLIIKKFEDGASYVDLKLRSPLDDITVGQTIRIYKSDVYKSIGTADKSGTYLSTSKVFK